MTEKLHEHLASMPDLTPGQPAVFTISPAARFDADGFDHHAACLICDGIEGCSHSVAARRRAWNTHPTPATDVSAEDEARRIADEMADRRPALTERGA